MNLAYGLFMAEAEGYLDTKESKLNACVKDFNNIVRRGGNPSTYTDEVLESNGLRYEDLNQREIDYLINNVKG